MNQDYENLGYYLTLANDLLGRIKYLPTIAEADIRIIHDKNGRIQYALYARRNSEGPDGMKRVAIVALYDLGAFTERLKQLIIDERPERLECEASIKRANYTISINEMMLNTLYDIEEGTDESIQLGGSAGVE